MGHDSLQFFLGQKLPFLAVGADVELRERVTGNLAIIVRPHHDTFQPHTSLPDSSIGQPTVCAEVGSEVLDELWCQFQHRHIRATVMRLDESRHILSRALHSPESTCHPILAHTFLLIGNVLVECTQ